MTRSRHFEYIVRTLFTIVLFFIAQLPQEYGVRVDKDAFMAAFSFTGEDGHRRAASPWPLGPSGSNDDRTKALEESKEMVEERGRTIPSVVLAFQKLSKEIWQGQAGTTIIGGCDGLSCLMLYNLERFERDGEPQENCW
jgi:hypothetical protein